MRTIKKTLNNGRILTMLVKTQDVNGRTVILGARTISGPLFEQKNQRAK